MPEQTATQKRAHSAYISKFARLEIRTTKEQQAYIRDHAEACGESVSGFINRAIQETIVRDNAAHKATGDRIATEKKTGE